MNWKKELCPPVRNPVVTSPYGWRMLAGARQFHDGVDSVNSGHNCVDRLNPIGTDVFAIADGQCTFDYDKYDDRFRMDLQGHQQDTAGNMVILKHLIGGKWYYVRYLHLLKNTIQNGEIVTKGQRIGCYADVGFSYGPHIHNDVYLPDWSKKVDPNPLFFDP